MVLGEQFGEATYKQVRTTTRNGKKLAVFAQTRTDNGDLIIDKSPHKILVDLNTKTYYYYGDDQRTTFEYTPMETTPTQPTFVTTTNWTNTTPATQPPVKYTTTITQDTVTLDFTWVRSQQPYHLLLYNEKYTTFPTPAELPTEKELPKPQNTHTHFGLTNQSQTIALHPINSTARSQTGHLTAQLAVNDTITITNTTHTLFKSPSIGEIYQIKNIPTGTYTITISNRKTNETTTYENVTITATEPTRLDTT